MKKIISVLLVVLTLFSAMSLCVSAATSDDYGVAPCFNNTQIANVDISINSSGLATVEVYCLGYSGSTTKIVANTKIERKFGLIWLDVSGASWNDTTFNYYLHKEHSFQLSKTGTYRISTTFTVSGSGGANDVFDATCTDTY